MSDADHHWAVILAGGEAEDVSSPARDRGGTVPPDPSWALGAGGTMLRGAIDRARGVVSGWRVVTVVSEGHRHLWDAELSDQPRENVLVQPFCRGTAPGLLLALLEILLRRDPHARVIVLPSGHHVADEGILRQTLAAALSARRWDARIVLVGMTPREADPESGWIEPGRRFAGTLKTVARLVEGVDPGTVRGLMRSGGLLNALILAADVGTLLRLYRDSLPAMFDDFVRWRFGRRGGLKGLFQRVAPADLWRDVLQRWPEYLLVLAAPECGWADLGATARIQALLDRLRAPSSAPSGSVAVRRAAAAHSPS